MSQTQPIYLKLYTLYFQPALSEIITEAKDAGKGLVETHKGLLKATGIGGLLGGKEAEKTEEEKTE